MMGVLGPVPGEGGLSRLRGQFSMGQRDAWGLQAASPHIGAERD